MQASDDNKEYDSVTHLMLKNFEILKRIIDVVKEVRNGNFGKNQKYENQCGADCQLQRFQSTFL